MTELERLCHEEHLVLPRLDGRGVHYAILISEKGTGPIHAVRVQLDVTSDVEVVNGITRALAEQQKGKAS